MKRVLKYSFRFAPLIAVSIAMSVISALLSLLTPVLAGRSIDAIADSAPLSVIRDKLLLVVLSALMCALAGWVMTLVNNRITFRIARDVRNDAFSHLMELPVSYIDGRKKGDVVSCLIADVDQFTDGLLMGFSQFFTGIVTIIGTLVFMFFLNWRIALVVVLLTPLSLIVARFIASRSYALFSKQAVVRSKQTALVEEMITGMKTVKAFGREEENMKSFDETAEALEEVNIKATFLSSLTNPGTRFVNNTVYAAVAFTGALYCMSGGMSIGSLTIFLSYANQYTKPFNEISSVYTELQNALACAARVFALIDAPAQTVESSPLTLKDRPRGEIVFDNVSFSYDKEKELIKDLDLKVLPGQRVAIVGPTGSGKTTMINLLMRFYDVDAGSVSIDGTDILKMDRQYLRSMFGMVLQETWLRCGTVRDQITLGRTGFSDDEIKDAAKRAHAHSFIRRLPDGYDTILDEDGGALSQGQKQLLCITRVMLSLPPMLILDEATSSIDTRTEMKIQSAFKEMMTGRTSFIVAHRLSTIREADIILVMKDGRVIESGNHKTLMEKDGFYAALYNSQFEAL